MTDTLFTISHCDGMTCCSIRDLIQSYCHEKTWLDIVMKRHDWILSWKDMTLYCHENTWLDIVKKRHDWILSWKRHDWILSWKDMSGLSRKDISGHLQEKTWVDIYKKRHDWTLSKKSWELDCSVVVIIFFLTIPFFPLSPVSHFLMVY